MPDRSTPDKQLGEITAPWEARTPYLEVKSLALWPAQLKAHAAGEGGLVLVWAHAALPV